MLFIFLFCPIISIVIMYFYYNEQKSKNYEWYFVIYCSIFVSLINMTKIPENDLVNYVASFERANGLSFFNYILVSGVHGACTDYGYDFYTWIISNVSNGNVRIYLFLTSFLSYLLLGYPIIKMKRFYGLSSEIVLTSLLLIFFIPYIFTLSLQLIRQYIAGCILVYLTFELLYYPTINKYLKKNWWKMLIMFSFHKSSLFFVIFLLCPVLRESFSKNKISYLFLLLLVLSYQHMSSLFLPFLGGDDNVLTQTINRASKDTSFELQAMSPLQIILVLMILTLSFYIAYIEKSYSKSAELKHIFGIVCMTTIFILFNLHQTELSNRFSFYLYPFVPFIVLFYLQKYVLLRQLFPVFLFGSLTAWILYVHFGVWDYQLPFLDVLSPVFLFFF